MKKIMFRGRSIKWDTWEYGYLFCSWRKAYILQGLTNNIPNMEEVIPETVGQYTGLNDKNGMPIYRGDILERDFEEGGWYAKGAYRAIVVYEEGRFKTDSILIPLADGKDVSIVGNIYERRNNGTKM